jgi:hypothetical protein
MADLTDIRETARERCSAAASAASERTDEDEAGCCRSEGVVCSPADASGVFGTALYDEEASAPVPEGELNASLGCGVPTAVADLHEGETVLDLGSGGGADVLISARRVGPSGMAVGLGPACLWRNLGAGRPLLRRLSSPTVHASQCRGRASSSWSWGPS